jgi:hypothetical protein
MVRSRVYLVLSLAVAASLSACFGASSLGDLIRNQRVPADAVVRLSADQAVGAKRDGSQVLVLNFANTLQGWQVHQIASDSAGSGSGSLHLLTLAGQTGLEWNTFVYGTAPAQVSRVKLSGFDYEGGQVADGAWVVVLQGHDLTPQDLRWEFVGATGAVIQSGDGIFPPRP